MKKYLFKITIWALAVSLILTGCAKKKEPEQADPGQPAEISYFVRLSANLSGSVNSLAETELFKELQKNTNVNIKVIHPAAGQETEQFNILLAGGDLPDIIEWDWLNAYPGGLEMALSDKKIIELNDLFDSGKAPNLKKYLSENPDIDKMVKTDSGKYYVFPFIRGDDILCVNFGITMRNDWLLELGMEPPETIDEYYEVLKAFKEKKGAASPLVFQKNDIGGPSDAFSGAYKATRNFYQENGKVKFGPIEPEFKEFLITMNKWYKEGLIDKDFGTIDRKTVDSKVLNGQAGAFLGYPGSHMGAYLDNMKKEDPTFDLIGTKYPVLNKGDRPQMGQMNPRYSSYGSVAITTNCKNVDAAARFLDYGYSEEGSMLYNFGIENVSYEKGGDSYVYTDLILNNPEGLSSSQALSRYVRSNDNGPFVQKKDAVLGYYKYPQQKAALEIWSDTDAANYKIPTITLTPEESKEQANILNEINTFNDEKYFQFIMGVEPLDKFDEYVAQIKAMGIDKVIEIRQTALDRYTKR